MDIYKKLKNHIGKTIQIHFFDEQGHVFITELQEVLEIDDHSLFVSGIQEIGPDKSEVICHIRISDIKEIYLCDRSSKE